MSPFESVARPMTEKELNNYEIKNYIDKESHVQCNNTTFYCGNFNGWISYRKEIPYEWNVKGKIEQREEKGKCFNT